MITGPTSCAIKYTTDDSELVKDELINFMSTETTHIDFQTRLLSKCRIY